jgi:carboxymethylenebutenolidase
MPVQAEWIHYGDQAGFLARPGGVAEPQPAVLVIQEVWGVDGHIEEVARRLASAGYAAFAPDLYLAGGVRPPELVPERTAAVRAFMRSLAPNAWADAEARDLALASLPAPERARIEASHAVMFDGAGSLDRFLPALRTAVRHLRRDCPASAGQPLGCVGFSMGGGLSALLASQEPELSAAAIFYGLAPPPERVAGIACPVLGFYGALDAHFNAGLPAFAEAMAAAGKDFEHHVYPGTPHSFFNDTGPAYRVAAARDSFARLLEFFRRHLAP